MAKPSAGKLYVVLRTVGELLVTLGVIVLLFVVYTLYVTDIVAARKQRDANSELDRSWSARPAQPQQRPEKLPDGKPFTRLYIPRFGADYRFAVIEGVDQAQLDAGPGHYPNSARPGEPGNFAVAGHRIGKGAPFNDLDELRACDPIVVETRADFLVYRVLPMAEQVRDWDRLRGQDPRCARVPSLRSTPDYRDTVGRKLVTPDRGDAVAPVPYHPDSELPIADQKSLLTLTTCHPEYGNSQRMIIHAVLTDQIGKRGRGGYPTLLRQLGEA
ncbi:MAG: class E sortase [Thermocrispum sp.]